MKSLKYFLAVLMLCSVSVRITAEEADGPDMRPIVCIEKDKIHNKTDNRRANFAPLIDRLNHELVQSGIYRVIDMQNLADVFKDNEKFAVAADDGGNKTNIQTPGFFIRMSISQYGISSERSRDVLYGQTNLAEVATVELILTVVNMRTAETIKSANIKAAVAASVTAAPGSVKQGNYREQALQEASKAACQDILKELFKLTPFYVMDVNGYEVMIDAPASVAPVGSMFDIFKTGKAIRNRRTGKVTRRETKICTIRITAPGEDGSTGQVVQLYVQEPVKADYIARPVNAAPVAAAAPATAAPAPAVPSAANPF